MISLSWRPASEDAEAEVCVGFVRVIAELAVQVKGLPEVGVGHLVTAEPGVGMGQPAVGVRLPGPIAKALGGVEAGTLGDRLVVPVRPSVEEQFQGEG
jgi:hypothetical protein